MPGVEFARRFLASASNGVGQSWMSATPVRGSSTTSTFGSVERLQAAGVVT